MKTHTAWGLIHERRHTDGHPEKGEPLDGHVNLSQPFLELMPCWSPVHRVLCHGLLLFGRFVIPAAIDFPPIPLVPLCTHAHIIIECLTHTETHTQGHTMMDRTFDLIEQLLWVFNAHTRTCLLECMQTHTCRQSYTEIHSLLHTHTKTGMTHTQTSTHTGS